MWSWRSFSRSGFRCHSFPHDSQNTVVARDYNRSLLTRSGGFDCSPSDGLPSDIDNNRITGRKVNSFVRRGAPTNCWSRDGSAGSNGLNYRLHSNDSKPVMVRLGGFNSMRRKPRVHATRPHVLKGEVTTQKARKSYPKVLPAGTNHFVTNGPVTPVLRYSRVVYVAAKRIPPPLCDN